MTNLLNYEEILAKNLFMKGTFDNNSFKNASYDLRIDRIIVINDKEDRDNVETYTIPPQGMVVATSQEIFQLPEDIIAYTTVKNGLSIKGLMVINVGLIDPKYEGPISSALINFGNKPVTIKKNDLFLRITFYEFSKPQIDLSKEIKFSKEGYYNHRKDSSNAHLDNTFLSLKLVTDDVLHRINQIRKEENIAFYSKITGIALIIAAISLVFNFIFTSKSQNNTDELLSKRIELLEKKQINNCVQSQLNAKIVVDSVNSINKKK